VQEIEHGRSTEAELLRLAEVRRFDFLYEAKQIELRRICSIAKTLFAADRASVVIVDSDPSQGVGHRRRRDQGIIDHAVASATLLIGSNREV